ncbi:type II secretion system protein [Moritella yayanosii]|uniref:Uncharacterized protein n=1 Tax=Moritella yayanosii TaxID=69539 RepID=A0A330LQQ9_9GAMM|nr:type II secretion system protein [Moritella yayanosii]SQD78516.1 conserved protein of unknown function [Moritella yayanosii]
MDFTASKRNKGFTLIELVITIIVLGVLAATAVPRFIDLKDDAKKETVENFHGSLRATVRLLHMKSQIDNLLGDNVTIATDYEDNGYSRIGYGSGDLKSGLCYAEYHHTDLAQDFTVKTAGC